MEEVLHQYLELTIILSIKLPNLISVTPIQFSLPKDELNELDLGLEFNFSYEVE